MRRQFSAKAVSGLAFFILLTGIAYAQYRYNPPYAPPAASALPPPEVIRNRFLLDLAAAVLGFMVGAFFSPLLRPFRLFVFFAILVAGYLYAWLGEFPYAEWLTNALAVFGFCVAFGYGIRLGAKALFWRREEADRPTSFGTAKWATEAYLRERGLFDGKGFILGEFIRDGSKNALHYSGARHLLTVAPTRSGKGVSSIIPNLLTYEGSAFVIDPKGENALITATRRGTGDAARSISGLGQAVYLLDPWNIAAPALGVRAACFNPLDWIKADDPDAAENAFLLADALVTSEAEGEARFWDDESKALLMGLILYVATAAKEAVNRHLGRVRDILMLDDEGFKTVLADMFNEPYPLVASTAARTAGKDPKLRSNVLAATQSNTHFLDSPRIRESLSRSDFRFEELKTKPMTVFLILPADRLKTFDRWLRMLIQQAITVNARNIEVKPAKPILFLLDEMPALGKLTMVEQAYSLMAGFGMVLWGIVQDLSQLDRIYGKGWQTFVSNSGVIQYFGSRDKITAEYFSTLCGVTTVRSKTLSYALGTVFGRSWSSTSGGNNSSSTSGGNESTSHTRTIGSNESQRQLAYPDELMVLKDHRQIIFVENLDPIRGTKLRWYENRHLHSLGIDLQPTSEPNKPVSIEPSKTPVEAPRAAPVSRPIQKPEPVSEPEAEPAQPYVVSTKTIGDAEYTAYSDGSIDVKTPTGHQRFASMAELRAYMAVQQSLGD